MTESKKGTDLCECGEELSEIMLCLKCLKLENTDIADRIHRLEIERDMFKADRDAIMKEFNLEIGNVADIRAGIYVKG